MKFKTKLELDLMERIDIIVIFLKKVMNYLKIENE